MEQKKLYAKCKTWQCKLYGLGSLECLSLGKDWIFQQNNDPKDAARIIMEWFLHHPLRQLILDLNPVTHVCSA